MPPDPVTRRDFLDATARLGVATVGRYAPPRADLAASRAPFRVPPLDTVRIGFVGVGGMGTVHVENLVQIEGARLTAICDIDEAHAAGAAGIITRAGQPGPALYTRGPRDFERMIAEQELDLVYTATPWEWHVPVCLEALRHGRHAATEVPAAYTVDDCWALVEASERARRHCVMMENCNYDRRELLVFNLIRLGLLGEVLYGAGGYLHDLRGIKFATDGEGLWRRAHAMRRNGNLYPTHGLGPVAQWFDVNRGDRFDVLVSLSSPARGLQLWQQEHLAPDDPRRAERYVLGDQNNTLIQTARGRLISVEHNTNNPRPYSRLCTVQGTRGTAEGWPDRVYIEGRGAAHRWVPMDDLYAEFEHPLWRSDRVRTASGGHGGMDFLEDWRLITCLRNGQAPDMDVYDAAALSVVGPLSERSVANRGRTQDVPDFTRGRWRTTAPIGIVEV